MITQFINLTIADLGSAITGLMALLPASPLIVQPTALNGVASVMGYASYFLPIHEAAIFIGLLIPAIIAFYAIRIALRWAKVAAS